MYSPTLPLQQTPRGNCCSDNATIRTPSGARIDGFSATTASRRTGSCHGNGFNRIILANRKKGTIYYGEGAYIARRSSSHGASSTWRVRCGLSCDDSYVGYSSDGRCRTEIGAAKS